MIQPLRALNQVGLRVSASGIDNNEGPTTSKITAPRLRQHPHLEYKTSTMSALGCSSADPLLSKHRVGGTATTQLCGSHRGFHDDEQSCLYCESI